MRKLPKVLSEGEQAALLGSFDLGTEAPTKVRNWAWTVLLLETGLRVAESVALLNEHLSLLEGWFVVREGKGAKDRTLYLSDPAHEAVCRWLKVRGQKIGGGTGAAGRPVFCTTRGTSVSPRYLRDMLKRHAERAGVRELEKVSPHTLRHTFATNLLRRTNNLRVVQEALGHESITTTQVYTHVTNEDLRRAMCG